MEQRGSYAVVVSMFKVRTVLEFLICWQLEDISSNGKLTIDLLLREAESNNLKPLVSYLRLPLQETCIKESDFVDGVPELIGKSLLLAGGIEVGQIKCHKIGPGY